MDTDKILSRLVQVGEVMAIDTDKLTARVKFPDTGIISDWLYVIQHRKAKIHIEPDGEHSHTCPDGETSTEPNHNHHGGDEHLSYVKVWMPEVGEQVLVLYYPVFNGDGFVLGDF